ncbi:M1 family aminopeptidase [Candidatus Bipolaricaulota bacterium]
MKWRTAAVFLGCILIALWFTGLAQTESLVTSYEIQVSLDTNQDTLIGSQIVNYVNDSDVPIQEITFALIANWGAEPNPYLHPALTDAQYTAGFDPTWTKVSQVTDAAGETLTFRFESTPPFLQTFSLENGLLIVELPGPLAPGAGTTIRLDFETKFARAMAMDNCVYKDTYVWRFGWNPVAVGAEALQGKFQLPAADYRVELTIPEDLNAFGGSDDQQELNTTSGLKTVEFSNAHPTRSVSLVIGPELDFVATEWNGVTIEAVFLPGGESYARGALSYAEEILAYHSEHFGPFAGKRLIIAENPTPGFFGMAADGLVLIGSSAVRLKDMPALGTYDRVNEYLLAHELAHMWWGIGIGTDFNAENWISEGFAEYLAISYFEDQHGAFDPNLLAHLQPGLVEDALSDAMGYLNLRQHLSELQYLTLLQLGFDEPIVQPIADSEYLNGISVRTYSKGYLVLRGLEAIIGQEKTHRILIEAQNKWNGKLLTVEEFRLLAERVSETDLSEFFAGWLYGDARFDVAISGFDTIESDTGYSTLLHLSGVDPTFPIDVEATLDDGSTVRMNFPANCCSASAPPLETELPITSIAIDPDEMLPDANRFNNHWPRKILVAHPFRSADAPVVGMPLDAYVIDISPTGISGGFRNDHAWSLMVLPHIDPEMDWENLDIEDLATTLDIVGFFGANVGRDLGISFTGMVTALDPMTGEGELDIALTALIPGFTHPKTGNAGRYWYPSWQNELTIGAIGELSNPIPYLEFSITRDDTLPMYMKNTLTLQLGVPGFGTEPFGTIEWRASKRVRVAHLFHVDVTASIAETLFEALPDEFLFSLDDLYAFDYLPMGHHQMFAALEVILPPLIRDSGYAIFNWTRLDSITPSAFIQGGRTQANCDIVCEPGIRLEAGAKLAFTFPGFLGATIRIEVGYAHPLVGVDGEGRFFINLGGSS